MFFMDTTVTLFTHELSTLDGIFKICLSKVQLVPKYLEFC